MDVPILHRMGNEFDHRNLWLQLVLGLLAAGERLDAVLARYAPERDAAATASGGDDEAVAFVLGLIACKTRLHEVLTAAARPAGDPATTPRPAPSGRAARDLLR